MTTSDQTERVDPSTPWLGRAGRLRRLLPPVLLGVVMLAILALATWCILLYSHHGSLALHTGRLPTGTDTFLGSSHGWAQRCTWHLGNGTRTWGQTYGIRAGRRYLTIEVTHVDPRRTPEEANE